MLFETWQSRWPYSLLISPKPQSRGACQYERNPPLRPMADWSRQYRVLGLSSRIGDIRTGLCRTASPFPGKREFEARDGLKKELGRSLQPRLASFPKKVVRCDARAPFRWRRFSMFLTSALRQKQTLGNRLNPSQSRSRICGYSPHNLHELPPIIALKGPESGVSELALLLPIFQTER